eukprot:TRINITY_DN1608_c0_g1_i1.p1 TRINITY_DN1608_c0_g1~~TRINITY_DN1608_c0_g1_i1.p1  ORF type:complete len:306 (-),score=54.64 TRINITY_DN1608_c0_g1_i1:734-1651(-)
MQTRTVPTLIENLTNIVEVAVGRWHVIVLHDMGRISTWGYGKKGRLGHGDELSHYRAKRINGLDRIRFVKCAADFSHSLALTDDGKIYSWGDGSFGKLGHGDEIDIFQPKIITGFPGEVIITNIKAGNKHSLALTDKGELYSWGCGKHGRLGHGNENDSEIPRKIACDEKFTAISAGKSHSIALTARGNIYVWGKGKHGQLGLGLGLSTLDCLQPKALVSEHIFVSVIASNTCSVALSEEGVIYTWGSCTEGRLGHGFSQEICWRPNKISGLESTIFSSLAVGHYHVVAVTGLGRNNKSSNQNSN